MTTSLRGKRLADEFPPAQRRVLHDDVPKRPAFVTCRRCLVEIALIYAQLTEDLHVIVAQE